MSHLIPIAFLEQATPWDSSLSGRHAAYVGMMVVDVLDFKHHRCSLLVILVEKPKTGFSAMLPDAELIRSFVKMSGRHELVPSLVRHAMPPLQEIPNDWECTAFVDNRTDLDTAILPQSNRLAKRILLFLVSGGRAYFGRCMG